MSVASQNKVSEEDGFREAHIDLDSVRLWDFIRRSHLTHIFGEGDQLLEVNVQEQESRYDALRQGERESINMFKVCFDNQVKANEGAGMPPATDSKRALEFIYRLDSRRYKSMLVSIKNDALENAPDAYPQTLASAFRIAAGWVSDEHIGHYTSMEVNSAYVTDTALVTKARDPEKGAGRIPGQKSAEKGKKVPRSSSTVICYVCGTAGHYARECKQRKAVEEKILLAKSDTSNGAKSQIWYTDDDEDATDEWELAHAHVTTTELCCFSKYDVLLDNEASLNVFSNRDLLTNIRKSSKNIVMKGVDASGDGVKIDTEGDFNEIGAVFVSENSSANIPSFAAQVDSGATVLYDHLEDRFSLTPPGSANTYIFGRKKVTGSEGRFYCCDVRTMVNRAAPLHGSYHAERALVQIVEGNLSQYSKREVQQALKARELLARMGFPSVSDAVRTIQTGADFGVTEKDFRIADLIWGRDVSSMKGKTKKRTTSSPDDTLVTFSSRQQQVLSIDVMYVERIPFLIGVAHPLDLTLVTDLVTLDQSRSSRCAETIFRGVKYFRTVLSSMHFTSPLLMSDGDGAIGKLQDDLMRLGIEVDISGAGGHVSLVERTGVPVGSITTQSSVLDDIVLLVLGTVHCT